MKRTVSKSKLKARMLEYFREVERTGTELLVTDRGIPVIRILPCRTRKTTAEVFGDLRSQVKYHGDITAPTSEEWDVI